MKLILFQPQIPQNTGNIVRTCKVTNSELILVKPLGFSVSNRKLKRAGLDYWEGVKVTLIEDLMIYLESTLEPFYFFSSKVDTPYSEISYAKNSIFIFGSETSGLDPQYFQKWPEKFVTIPMVGTQRCLNLASSAAIALYEAYRQHNFTFSE